MKNILTILVLAFLVSSASAQSKPTPVPAATPAPASAPTAKESDAPTAEEAELLGKLLLLELTSAGCAFDDSKTECKTIIILKSFQESDTWWQGFCSGNRGRFFGRRNRRVVCPNN